MHDIWDHEILSRLSTAGICDGVIVECDIALTIPAGRRNIVCASGASAVVMLSSGSYWRLVSIGSTSDRSRGKKWKSCAGPPREDPEPPCFHGGDRRAVRVVLAAGIACRRDSRGDLGSGDYPLA
jgi:hypothetical protein